MNFLYPIFTEITECQDCYKCVRQCPIKAIRVENNHAMVIPELCVMCGRCVTNCPAKAKHVRDDLGRTQQLFKLKNRVIASLAPSFATEFRDIPTEVLILALKKLGFFGVSETAIGADLVSSQIADDLNKAVNEQDGQKLFLSSACPVVVEYIKHALPEYSEFITNRASPLLAHSRYLKKIYGEDTGIVFIGPCIAKKREADVFKAIDVAISFNDLRKWFLEANIDLTNPKTLNVTHDFSECCFIPEKAAKGALFPIDGGMISAIKKYSVSPKVATMSVSGIDQIADTLHGLDNVKLQNPLFIELLSCTGGCVNGPGAEKDAKTAIKRIKIEEYTQNNRETASTEVLNNKPDITGILSVDSKTKITHDDNDIRAALRSVGKYSRKDELNCGSCGYDTCRSFAEAMLDKRAEKTMCLSYMRKLAQKKANGLIRAIPGGVVIADKNLSIVECNKNFAKLMGKDIEEMYELKPGLEGASLEKITDLSRFFNEVLSLGNQDVIERDVRSGKRIFHISIFTIEPEEIAGGVIEDITQPQIQKHRIVSQAKKVIEKNLSVVQKIAFLLGENAAETESTLNSIIDFSGEDDNQDDSK